MSTAAAQRAKIAASPAAPEMSAYLRATNYLAAAQIYLRGNCLLGEPLRPEHIKPRLLGHWGTCPGINLVYASLNRLILEREAEVLLVTGPGHGAAANLANLWLEGSLEEIDPSLGRDRSGLFRLVRSFSWPDGFPSHLGPMVPGVIHEGGELGYALATAVGAALDNPDLIVACIVGDGEAETGPTATAWHSTKYLDPASSGAVLPFLHLNGYKIASPTVFATMSDEELAQLFAGYGWQPRIVDGPDYERELSQTLSWAHDQIRAIQTAARAGERPERPRWPMVILRTPKGLSGIAELDGVPITGTSRTHQVPAKDAAANPVHLAALEAWLRSYRPHELFDYEGCPVPEVLTDCPTGERRLGMSPHANGGRLRRPLDLPDIDPIAVAVSAPGAEKASALETTGVYLREVIQRDRETKQFRIVSPDELASNRLQATLEVTGRAYEWPVGDSEEGLAADGRVMEMLSEHNCQGWLQGYLLTGRHGVFPCYEAFISIVDGMVNQYAKFLKAAREVSWREPVSSLNYILTSEGWRQEHNGYSHQGPGFINTMLNKKSSVVRVYLPPDANTTLATMEHCLDSTGYINVVIASKAALPQWLSLDEARRHCRAGAADWRWAGSADDEEPDVVLACAGTIPTVETLAAAQLLRADAPELRVRVVNVTDLLVLAAPGDHPHGMAATEFEALFGRELPIVFNFHGYPSAVHQLLHHRPEPERFHVKGYIEEGTTTTPFDLLVSNGVSRYQLAIEALRRAEGWSSRGGALIGEYEHCLRQHRRYIVSHDADPPEIADWSWS